MLGPVFSLAFLRIAGVDVGVPAPVPLYAWLQQWWNAGDDKNGDDGAQGG